VALDFHFAFGLMAWAALGVALVGLVNLTMSFSLALFVALRARGVNTTQQGLLFGSLWRHFRHHTREFFLPPKKPAAAAAVTTAPDLSDQVALPDVVLPEALTLAAEHRPLKKQKNRKKTSPISVVCLVFL